MDFKIEIGRRIREARAEKSWTLKDLSRKTQDVLSVKRLSHYEVGRRMPGPSEAVMLATALGKRAAWIMALDEAQVPISLLEESLIRNWRTLSERDRMAFVRQLEIKAMESRDPVSDQQVARSHGGAPVSGTRRRTESPSQ